MGQRSQNQEIDLQSSLDKKISETIDWLFKTWSQICKIQTSFVCHCSISTPGSLWHVSNLCAFSLHLQPHLQSGLDRNPSKPSLGSNTQGPCVKVQMCQMIMTDRGEDYRREGVAKVKWLKIDVLKCLLKPEVTPIVCPGVASTNAKEQWPEDDFQANRTTAARINTLGSLAKGLQE